MEEQKQKPEIGNDPRPPVEAVPGSKKQKSEKLKLVTKYFLIFFTLLSAYFSWYSVSLATNVPGASNWFIPSIWFSLFFVFLSLDFIIISGIFLLILLVIASISLSFIFAFDVWHIPASLIGIFLVLIALERMRNDLKLNIKLSVWKTMRTGRLIVVVAIALIIGSQYFIETSNSKINKTIPEFSLGEMSGPLTNKIISAAYPQFQSSDDGELTVDDLILKNAAPQLESYPDPSEQIDGMIEERYGDSITEEEKSVIKNQALQELENNSVDSEKIILEEGRRNLSKYVGKELKGDEKVSEVFSGIINSKMNEFFKPNVPDSGNSVILPFIFSMLIFLTIISVGPLFAFVSMVLAKIIFFILVKTGLVEIAKIPAEKEIIK